MYIHLVHIYMYTCTSTINSRDAEKGKATQQHMERQSNTTQLKSSFAASGGIQTHDHQLSRQCSAKLSTQLSWLGRILYTNHKASQPDTQVNSNLVFRSMPTCNSHVQVLWVYSSFEVVIHTTNRCALHTDGLIWIYTATETAYVWT